MLLSDTSTVLFDFDQTLGKAKSHYGMYVQAANEYNISVTVNDLAQTKLDDAWEKWMTLPDGMPRILPPCTLNANAKSVIH